MNFLKILSFFLGTSLGILLASLPKEKVVAQTNLRLPILLVYGYSDGDEQRLFIGTNAYQVVNVITGHTNKGPTYFSQKGVLFAYRVNAVVNPVGGGGCQTETACTNYLVSEWKKPFDKGYQAITLDKLCSTSNLVNNSQAAALTQIRQLYPSKYIFAWGGTECSMIGVGYDVESLLQRVKQTVNYFLPAFYISESNPNRLAYTDMILTRMERTAPGILDKSLIALAIADTEDFTYDTEPGIEFKEFLDEEFHFLKTLPVISRLKGIAIYSYARSRPDNIVWLQNLFNHYFLQNKTDYYSPDGYQLGTIKNGSFEEGTANWQISPGSGSSASVVTYTDLANNLNCKIVGPAPQIRVPHPNLRNCMVPTSHALYFNKKTGLGSTVSQTVNISPNTAYVIDMYVRDAGSDNKEANFEVSLSGSQTLTSSLVKEKSTFKSYFSSCTAYNISDFLWTKMKIFFTTGDESTISFTISDRQASANNKLVIDFVQMEKAKGQMSAGIPTPSPGNPTATPTPQCPSCPVDKPLKEQGNADCDADIDSDDFNLWKEQFHDSSLPKSADFHCDGRVDGIDFEYWRRNKP